MGHYDSAYDYDLEQKRKRALNSLKDKLEDMPMDYIIILDRIANDIESVDRVIKLMNKL